MGIGFVLLAWAIVSAVFAGLAALILGSAVAYFTRRLQRSRKRLIIAASLFPFLCLIWMAAVFTFQAVVNEGFLHRDAGLGDAWKCPLPNGYALLMIDTTERGFVYNLKTQPGSAVAEQSDALAEVQTLQLSGRYILGGSDGRSFEKSKDDVRNMKSYFVLDTQSGTHTNFDDYESLRKKAFELGINLRLENIDAIYRRYRFTWFEKFVAILFFLPPIIGFVSLIGWVVRVRKTGVAAT